MCPKVTQPTSNKALTYVHTDSVLLLLIGNKFCHLNHLKEVLPLKTLSSFSTFCSFFTLKIGHTNGLTKITPRGLPI